MQGGTGWKAQETVVNFETGSSVRRGGAEVAQVARPLLTDPDSEGNKYKRRAPTDWLLRYRKRITGISIRFIILLLQVVEVDDQASRPAKTVPPALGAPSYSRRTSIFPPGRRV